MHKKKKNKKHSPGPHLFFDKTLDFHGYTGNEAIYELEEALYTYESESILIVHGKGTGILKKRVREFLAYSSLPESVEYGENINLPGGDGVTVVYL